MAFRPRDTLSLAWDDGSSSRRGSASSRAASLSRLSSPSHASTSTSTSISAANTAADSSASLTLNPRRLSRTADSSGVGGIFNTGVWAAHAEVERQTTHSRRASRDFSGLTSPRSTNNNNTTTTTTSASSNDSASASSSASAPSASSTTATSSSSSSAAASSSTESKTNSSVPPSGFSFTSPSKAHQRSASVSRIPLLSSPAHSAAATTTTTTTTTTGAASGSSTPRVRSASQTRNSYESTHANLFGATPQRGPASVRASPGGASKVGAVLSDWGSPTAAASAAAAAAAAAAASKEAAGIPTASNATYAADVHPTERGRRRGLQGSARFVSTAHVLSPEAATAGAGAGGGAAGETALKPHAGKKNISQIVMSQDIDRTPVKTGKAFTGVNKNESSISLDGSMTERTGARQRSASQQPTPSTSRRTAHISSITFDDSVATSKVIEPVHTSKSFAARPASASGSSLAHSILPLSSASTPRASVATSTPAPPESDFSHGGLKHVPNLTLTRSGQEIPFGGGSQAVLTGRKNISTLTLAHHEEKVASTRSGSDSAAAALDASKLDAAGAVKRVPFSALETLYALRNGTQLPMRPRTAITNERNRSSLFEDTSVAAQTQPKKRETQIPDPPPPPKIHLKIFKKQNKGNILSWN